MSFISQIFNNTNAAVRGNWGKLKPLEFESFERHTSDIAALALAAPLVATLGIKTLPKMIALGALTPVAIIAFFSLGYES